MSVAATAAIALLLATNAEVANQPCVKEGLALSTDFRKCAVAKAGELEPSGESAGDIAAAAISSCGEIKAKYLTAVMTCLPQTLVTALGDHLDSVARDNATQAVVEMRAAKNPKQDTQPPNLGQRQPN